MSKRNYANRSHSFAVAPTVSMPRSTFPTPSRTTSTIDAGFIYPMFVDCDVLPGDTYRINMRLFGRLATPLRPYMDNLWVDTHVFFVPHRIVYENWERLQGAQANPDSSIDFTVPQIEIAGGSSGLDLADYMGIPTTAIDKEVSALPFRAYNKIYNEFYREQNVVDSLTEDYLEADVSTEANHVLKRRMKRKDYKTGGLPWPQKGDAVDLPIGSTAPLVLDSPQVLTITGTSDDIDFHVDGSPNQIQTVAGDTQKLELVTDPSGVHILESFNPETEVDVGGVTGIVDLTLATSVTLSAFRSAIAIQHILELDARAGTRTPELLKARWGVTSPDSRLQRPEYIGGSSQNISVTPVPVTSDTAAADPGDVTGYGTTVGDLSCTHSFTEHGTILVLVSIRADYMYYTGLDKMWSRLTRYDHYEPAMAHLSEQAVLSQEVFCDGGSGDSDIFAYQERWSEYKYGRSMCTGLMRPNAPSTLAQWNLAQLVDSRPTLSETYLEENPPVDRVIAVDTEPHFLIDCFYNNAITRVMPVHNTPGLTRL